MVKAWELGDLDEVVDGEGAGGWGGFGGMEGEH